MKLVAKPVLEYSFGRIFHFIYVLNIAIAKWNLKNATQLTAFQNLNHLIDGKCSRVLNEVLIAEILKYFYPRSVDLHNYSAVNSKSAKAKNWETLNKKVLKRLKIPISNDMISDLSSAVPGAAEELLQKIKDKVEAVDMSSESVTSFDSSRDENAPSYEEISQALQDCQQQITEKEEVINSLKADVVHVRGLLKLKEQHIADLTAQMKRLQEKCSDEIKGNNEILSFI